MRTPQSVTSSNRLVALLLALTLGAVAGCGDDDAPPSTVGGSGAMDGGGSGGAGADDGGGGVGADGGFPPFDGAFPPLDGSVDGADRDSGPTDPRDEIPLGWLCRDSLWGDGTCDCGCGAPDYDCLLGGCYEPGCSLTGCEACFATNGAWMPCVAQTWTCDAAKRDDVNNFCDCGCGAPDPDCNGQGCTTASCREQSCNRCHDDSSAVVDCAAPNGWQCALSAYSGGNGCDCGCGVIDPDCSTGGCAASGCSDAACDSCRDGGGDSVPCGVPSGWLCNPLAYDGDDGCDCGCGVTDPDCNGGGCAGNACTATTCDACHYDGITAACAIPSGWFCSPAFYDQNGVCDCGCGAVDPDCAGAGCVDAGCTATGCDLCHATGAGPAGGFVACGAWTCDPSLFGDAAQLGECDCGCGATDPDCVNRPSCTTPGCEAETCNYCSDSNGRRACGNEWTCAFERYGDGHCDCGCGAADPDCAGAGCSEPGCRASACETCLGVNGLKTFCEVGSCPSSVLGSGDGCDCGCGVVDADCDGLSACTQPGCSASECARCYDPLGRVINCL